MIGKDVENIIKQYLYIEVVCVVCMQPENTIVQYTSLGTKYCEWECPRCNHIGLKYGEVELSAFEHDEVLLCSKSDWMSNKATGNCHIH